jgi:hypothetical protein
MPPKKSKRKAMKSLNMLVTEEWIATVDEFRKAQPGILPNRSDTIRSLIEWAVEHYPKKTPLKAPKK